VKEKGSDGLPKAYSLQKLRLSRGRQSPNQLNLRRMLKSGEKPSESPKMNLA